MSQTILVTGASGNLGGAVVRHLIDTFGVAPSRIVATTRKPEKLAELSAKGVAVRAIDFDDQASIEKAFSGADRILVVSTDSLGVPGERKRQHLAAIAAAKTSGASSLFYTSMPKPEPGASVVFADDHFGSEEAVKASGLTYSIFRNNWYFENLLHSLPHAVGAGQWYTSSGDGRIAYAGRDDMAAAIAGRLASPAADNKTYDLAGPVSYAIADVAAMAGKIAGKPIQVVNVPDEGLAAGLAAAGVPAGMAAMLVSFDKATRNGDLAGTSSDIAALSGRTPLTLEAYLESSKSAWLG